MMTDAVSVINRSHTRTDNQNLTNIFDTVVPANNMSFWMENANRLQNAFVVGAADSRRAWKNARRSERVARGGTRRSTQPVPAKAGNGVGNRTTEITTAAGITTTDTLGYPATSNKIANMTRAAATLRSFVHDAGGNITSDTRSGTAYVYTYNNRNRLATVTVAASLKGTYTYNAKEQLSIRVTSNMTPSGTTHFIHDLNGNVIAETAGGGATGTTGTVREYIYLPETEIAPAADGRTRVDRPLAVVSAVNTATPATYYVHVDHLNRPVMMTDGAKAQVWAATWQAWGGSYAITGPQANDMRFPGQWFQLESGLHYNWHRHYDPSIGRYTQPDPLGFVDGPSVFGYAKGGPLSAVDPDGRAAAICVIPGLCPLIIRKTVEMCLAVGVAVVAEMSKPKPQCEKARDFQLKRAKIQNEHAFKTDWGATPNRLFEICACRDGSIQIARTNQCGFDGPKTMTDRTWK